MHAVASLFGADAAHRHRIDGFEVARIRNQVDVELFARRRGVHAGRAHVVFHVAGSQHAARVYILETRDHIVHGLRDNVCHHVQTATVAHSHHGVDTAQLTGCIEHGVEQGDKRRIAFERKALAAEVAALQNLFKKVRTDETVEDFRLVYLELRPLHAPGDPIATVQFENVQKFDADGAAIDTARLFGVFAGQPLEIGAFQRREIAQRVEVGFVEAPAAEEIKDAFTFGMPGAVAGVAFFGSFRGFFRSECHTVCHGSCLQTYYFATNQKCPPEPASRVHYTEKGVIAQLW